MIDRIPELPTERYFLDLSKTCFIYQWYIGLLLLLTYVAYLLVNVWKNVTKMNGIYVWFHISSPKFHRKCV